MALHLIPASAGAYGGLIWARASSAFRLQLSAALPVIRSKPRTDVLFGARRISSPIPIDVAWLLLLALYRRTSHAQTQDNCSIQGREDHA